MPGFSSTVLPNISHHPMTRSVRPKGSGHIGQGPLNHGTHRPWDNYPKNALSKGTNEHQRLFFRGHTGRGRTNIALFQLQFSLGSVDMNVKS